MSSQEIQYSLVVNTELTYTELRKLEITLIRIMSYVQQFSGSADLKKMIQTMQQAIVTIRTMQIALHALQAARALAGDPTAWIYWAYAGTTVVAAGISGYSIYESMVGA